MASKRKKRRDSLPASEQATFGVQKWRNSGWLYPFSLGAIIVGGGIFVAMLGSGPNSHPDLDKLTLVGNTTEKKLPSLGDLALMSAVELQKQDIALMNLRCAEGLPGSEKLDIEKCRWQLSQWAAKVKSETDRHLYRVHDPRYAKQYRNSEAFFRASMMLQVLQEDCGVHYNHQRIRDIDFTDSRDLFLHGMIGNDNGGTCVSMPVLYTAIGRRLGYPIKLVLAKAHVFCRWDGPNDRFNIEGSGEGFTAFEDDYYMKWPKPITEAEVKKGLYLQSLSAREEMAVFLAARGHSLEDNGQLDECYVAYSLANQLAPKHLEYGRYLVMAVGKRHDARMVSEAASRAHLRQIQQIGNHYQAQMQRPDFANSGLPTPYQSGYRGPKTWNPNQNQFSSPMGNQPVGYFPNRNSLPPNGNLGY